MSDQPGFPGQPGPSNFPGPGGFPPQQPPQPQPFGGQPMQPGGYGPPPGGPTSPFGANTSWMPSTPPPSSGGNGGRTALIIISLIVVAGLSVAGWLITRDAEDKALDTINDINATIPTFTVPDLSDITVPTFTIPSIPEITVPDVSVATVPGATIPVIGEPGGTVPATAVPDTAPATTLPVPPAAVNLFEGTQTGDMVAAIAAARGATPLRILDLNLYPNYAFADVQDPGTPANVDEFGWRDGKVQDGSTPVQLTGDGDLESNLFSDTDVNWAAIPGLVGAALVQIPIEGAQVTHVHVSRNLPFSADVQIRVFVDGTRTSGYLDADAQGNIISVDPG